MNNYDTVSKYQGGVIQYGSFNDRIYLIKPPDSVDSGFVDSLISLAENKKYSKIFAKVQMKHYRVFYDRGFVKEALVPRFYTDNESAVFMGYYLNKARMADPNTDKYNEIIEKCSIKNNNLPVLNDGYKIVKCSEKDIPQLSAIYGEVFSSYPFPVHDKKYLEKTMNRNVDYFGVEKGSKLVAVSSAEKDFEQKNAEMTDFATIPEYRGKGLSQLLLLKMENELERKGFRTFYTIARAVSPGMNITFSKLGYEYNGRLINNTQICGSLESMNVWSKVLTVK